MKSILAIAIASLFPIQGLGQRGQSGTIGHETEFFLAVKSKCKASVMSFRCEGGIKFDEKKLSGWKKDPFITNYYEYTESVEPDLFKSHHEKRDAFLKTACESAHYEADDKREIFTCVENGKKQQIKFQLHQFRGAYGLVCDKDGGTAWLKLIFPKANWIEGPKTPHFYRDYGLAKEKREELSEFIRQTIQNPPEGCRPLDCPLFVPIPDGCEREQGK